MNSMRNCLMVAAGLACLQVAPAMAQVVKQPVFQTPERVGRVDGASISPAVIVINGQRFDVAPRIMLTREGVNEFATYAQIVGELPGKSIGYGFALGAEDSQVVDRILIRGSSSAAATTGQPGAAK